MEIARKYSNRQVLFEDLVQEGVLGFLEAVKRFNPNAGARLSTYAAYWIRMFVSKHAAEYAGPLTVPVGVVKLRRRATKAMTEIAVSRGQSPTPEDIAEYLGIAVERLAELASADWVKSYWAADSADSTDPESLPASCGEHAVQEKCFHALDAYTKLSKLERRLVAGRVSEWGQPRKPLRAKLSEELKVSGERIRQMEVEATRKLLRMMEEQELRDERRAVSASYLG